MEDKEVPAGLDTEQLVAQEKKIWNIEIPKPPQKILEILESCKRSGLNTFEPIFLPKIKFKKGTQLREISIGLRDWFYDEIEEGHLEKSAAELPGR